MLLLELQGPLTPSFRCRMQPRTRQRATCADGGSGLVCVLYLDSTCRFGLPLQLDSACKTPLHGSSALRADLERAPAASVELVSPKPRDAGWERYSKIG